MSWFTDLVGFPETDAESVRAQLDHDGARLTSRVNGGSWACGTLSTPSLAELRQTPIDRSGPVTLRELVGNVQALHCDPAHAGALFQAASQFNLLEMAGPTVTPDQGVGIYEHDHTQGPACAIACGAGTIVRNYFAPVAGALGQTADRQVDCLADIGAALGNDGERLWRMQNGYAFVRPEGRRAIAERLAAMTDAEVDALRGRLRIGLVTDTEVTLRGAGHRVTQVYGSALPVAYGGGPAAEWEPFARLVLDASYEATLRAAAANASATGHRTVFLTLLGGGVFGNALPWITDAIWRALETVGPADLDVAIVSYGRSRREVAELAARWTRR